MSGWDGRGNGLQAWDDAYEEGGVWDEYNGGPRTRAFGEALLRGLNDNESGYMERFGCTVLDWGCGLGEITALLRGRFPDAVVTGLDFSETAIRRATETFGPPFIRADSIDTTYDVIVASNVHEHFVDYLGLTREHLARCRDMYVILTPYEENLGDGEAMTIAEREAAGHAHVHRFSDESFPADLDGWRMVSRLVEPGPLWPGRQLMAVYTR